jgi:integrative and conjugative element protein (TIGR02256 family)
LARRLKLLGLWVPSARITFDIGQSGQQLMIERQVMQTFEKHQQLEPGTPEAGGQLFGSLSGTRVRVRLATGPRPTDIRSRYSSKPNRAAEQAEIDYAHKKGLFYLGDWHTHPEPVPTPSAQDLQSIRETFKKSTHHLNGFLLVIAGTERLPSGLYVAIHNDEETVRLVARTDFSE